MEAVRTDRHHAWAVINAVLDYDPTLVVVGPPDSALVATADRHGVSAAVEFRPPPSRAASANPAPTDSQQLLRQALEAAATGRFATIRISRSQPVVAALAGALVAGLRDAGHEPRRFAP